MGQKVHPVGFRLGITRDWESQWFAERNYRDLLHEDLKIRRYILELLPDAGISHVGIERNANQITVAVHTARPGIVIGRGGSRVEELRKGLDNLTGKRVRVNIIEIRQPELDAHLVARSIAEQLQRRVSHRRAMKQGAQRTMQRGAEGVKITVAGRLGGSEMSRRHKEMQGRVPLHTLRADIDYGLAEAHTTYGSIGVKVWIYRGQVLPKRGVGAAAEAEEVQGPAPAIQPEAVRSDQPMAEEAATAGPIRDRPAGGGPARVEISAREQAAEMEARAREAEKQVGEAEEGAASAQAAEGRAGVLEESSGESPQQGAKG